MTSLSRIKSVTPYEDFIYLCLGDDILRTFKSIESKQLLFFNLGLWLRRVLGIAHHCLQVQCDNMDTWHFIIESHLVIIFWITNTSIGFRAKSLCAHYIIEIGSMIIKKMHN